MRRVSRVIAIVLCLIGVIWIAQGLGFLPGSFMTGQREWAVYGTLALIGGLGLAWWLRRMPRA